MSKMLATDLTFSNPIEQDFDSELVDSICGIYDIFKNSVYSIFSYEGINYLFFKDRIFRIDGSIDVKSKVNWSKEELSSFEILHLGKSIIEVVYKNEHEGILLPFDQVENWEDVNFGYILETLVTKVHNDPECILFPSSPKQNV